jgi:hypothetical protein
MNKKEICVVIPIYKESLNDFEIQSVEQCIKVLSDYSIHFVYPRGLNIDFYKEKFKEIEKFTYFDKHYFDDLAGYNKLMLRYDFYKAFDKYKYMLLHQTDSYVFRDALLDWANKDYDYIGGIWFEKYVGNPFSGAKLWYAGNGGLSLRKIESIMRLLVSKKPLLNISQLIIENKKLYKNGRISFFKAMLMLPFNVFGYKNNHSYRAKTHILNEDVFYIESYSKYKALNIPNVEDAISFSWDRCPAYLFEKLKQLPFACHAWYRDDLPYEGNTAFWSDHIKINIQNA